MTSENRLPPYSVTTDEIIDVLHRVNDDQSMRAVHAIGVSARGTFFPSSVAPLYSKAAHFQPKEKGGGYPIEVRFSNGSGFKDPHDSRSDVRGMAVRFTLPKQKNGAKAAYCDLIAMTLPEFFSSNPDEFLAFALAAQPKPYLADKPWRRLVDLLSLKQPMRKPYPGETLSPDRGAIKFADDNDVAKPGVADAAEIGAPVSYLRAAYHAVHTFVVTNADGVQRWVRFSWQPILGVKNIPPLSPYDLAPGLDNGDEYLARELASTLDNFRGKDHPRFSLMMTIGEAGDEMNNPARAWPPHRTRVMMGTLNIVNKAPGLRDEFEKTSFNPGLLTDGIALSDDPVLKFRVMAYKRASEKRGAEPCPFMGGSDE